MVAPSAAASDPTIISRWTRDYRLSRTILLTGVVVFAGVLAFAYWGNLTGNYPTTSGTGPAVLAIDVIGSAGFAMICVGAIYGFHNWSLLRENRRLARSGPPS